MSDKLTKQQNDDWVEFMNSKLPKTQKPKTYKQWMEWGIKKK